MRMRIFAFSNINVSSIKTNKMKDLNYRSIVKLDFQYAHRFMNYPGEASYLHGHSGLLTLEIEGGLNEKKEALNGHR